jgi:O-antigen/teichoic acid export membrane protein
LFNEEGDSISLTEAPTLLIRLRERFSSQARLLATQGALALVAQGVRMGLALLIVPITLTYLGKDRYGLWMLALSTLSFVTLLDAGISPTLKNKMAESFAREDEEAFHHYASGGWLLACSVMAVGALVLPILALINWSAVYGVTGQVPRAEVQNLTLACFGVSALSVALSFIEALFAARLLLGTVYIYNTVAAFVSVAAVLGAIHFHAGLVVLAISASASAIIARLALLFTAHRRGMIRFSLSFRRFGSLLRDVLPTSASFVGIQLANVTIGAVPNLITSRLAGLSSVAILSIGQRVVTLPLVFVASVVPVLWPAFTIAWAKGDKAWIRRQFVRLAGTTAIVLGVYACAITIGGPAIIRLWLHGSVSVPRAVLAALGVWLVFQSVSHWVSTFLNSITDLHSQLVCYAGQALASAILSALLGVAYGLPGIIMGVTIALALANLAPLGWRVYSSLRQVEST